MNSHPTSPSTSGWGPPLGRGSETVFRGILDEVSTHRLRYQEFFEFAPDSQVVTDAYGVILEANHAAASLLRCAKEFLINKPLGLFVLYGYRSRFYECLTRIGNLSDADEFETRVGRRNETRDVAVRAAVSERSPSGFQTIRWLLRDITERRTIELARAELLQRLVTAQEDERRRIALELHDEMGQHLTALILDLKLLGDTFPPNSCESEQLKRVRQDAGRISLALHRLATELRPTSLDDLGLEVTLRNHVEEWSSRNRVPAEFRGLGPLNQRTSSTIETSLYRIMQEALTNVAKHAKATQVSVILERRENSLHLIVEDNGRGFDPENVMKSSKTANCLGLLGMRERVTMTGGSLIIESEIGGPTSIFVEIPCPSPGTSSTHG